MSYNLSLTDSIYNPNQYNYYANNQKTNMSNDDFSAAMALSFLSTGSKMAPHLRNYPNLSFFYPEPVIVSVICFNQPAPFVHHNTTPIPGEITKTVFNRTGSKIRFTVKKAEKNLEKPLVKSEDSPRTRKVLSAFQKKRLENSYSENKYPSRFNRGLLANELKMNRKKIDDWFKNKRYQDSQLKLQLDLIRKNYSKNN